MMDILCISNIYNTLNMYNLSLINNLPNEVLQNIIHYAGKSAKYINSRFYEIALDCKWNYKLIDLSTITIEELKKNSNIEYIKVIVTKDRSIYELTDVIRFLFDPINFKLENIHIKVPVDFKSKDEIQYIKTKNSYINEIYEIYDATIISCLLGCLKQQYYLKILIFDISEKTEIFEIIYNNNHFNTIFLFIIDAQLYSIIENKKVKLIHIKYFNLKAGNFIVYNGEEMHIDFSRSLECTNLYYFECESLFNRIIKICDGKIYLWSLNFTIGNKSLTIKLERLKEQVSFNNVLIKQFGTDNLDKILRLK